MSGSLKGKAIDRLLLMKHIGLRKMIPKSMKLSRRLKKFQYIALEGLWSSCMLFRCKEMNENQISWFEYYVPRSFTSLLHLWKEMNPTILQLKVGLQSQICQVLASKTPALLKFHLDLGSLEAATKVQIFVFLQYSVGFCYGYPYIYIFIRNRKIHKDNVIFKPFQEIFKLHSIQVILVELKPQRNPTKKRYQ